jgi:hypothetical protein
MYFFKIYYSSLIDIYISHLDIKGLFPNSQAIVFGDALPSGKELLRRASFFGFHIFPHKIAR